MSKHTSKIIRLGCGSLMSIAFLGCLLSVVYIKLNTESIPKITSLPNSTDFIVFSGSRKVSPIKEIQGIFVLDVSTGTIWQWEFVKSNILPASSLKWTEQQSILIFVRQTSSLLEVTRSGTPTLIQTFPKHPDLVDLSPDGSVATISDNQSISIVTHPIGQEVIQLTDRHTTDSAPNWSPNGDEIVFSSTKYNINHIYKINPDGTQLLQLTSEIGGHNWFPHWSPDGNKIAFINQHRWGLNSLMIMNSDGTDLQSIFTLTPDDNGTIMSFAWSPNGQQIAFSSDHEGPCELIPGYWDVPDQEICEERIYVINIDGSGLKTLTKEPQINFRNLVWVP